MSPEGRRSKHDEKWRAARDLTKMYPGEWLKVLTYTNAGQPRSIAAAINNGEHRYFVDDDELFAARSAENDDGTHSVWLIYKSE